MKKVKFLCVAFILFASTSYVYSYTPPEKKKPVQTKPVEKKVTVTEEETLSNTSSLSESSSSIPSKPVEKKVTVTEEETLSNTSSLSESSSSIPLEHSDGIGEINDFYFSVGWRADRQGIGSFDIGLGKIGEKQIFKCFNANFGGSSERV